MAAAPCKLALMVNSPQKIVHKIASFYIRTPAQTLLCESDTEKKTAFVTCAHTDEFVSCLSTSLICNKIRYLPFSNETEWVDREQS